MAIRQPPTPHGTSVAVEHAYIYGAPVYAGPSTTIYAGTSNFFDHPVYISSPDRLIHMQPTSRIKKRVFDSLVKEAGGIRGPNLPDIIDGGRIDDRSAFIVMRLPDGEMLSQRVERQGALDPDATYKILRGVVRALDATREQAAPHRGPTADRIWLCEDGSAILLGYGEVLRRREINNLSGRTYNETWWHIPPEVFRDAGDDLPKDDAKLRSNLGTDALLDLEDSHAAEVWAVGCLAYYCLVGSHPYYVKPNDPQHGIINVTTNARLPLPERVSYLQPVIDRALAPQPEARYEDAKALVSAFHMVLHPGTSEDDIATTAPQRIIVTPSSPARDPLQQQLQKEAKHHHFRARLWQVTAVALFVALLSYAWLDLRRPRSVILTSDPIGIEIVEVTGHLNTPRGRTPLVLSQRRLGDPITLRTVGPGGDLGEESTMVPSDFEDLGRCVQAQIIPQFVPARGEQDAPADDEGTPTPDAQEQP